MRLETLALNVPSSPGNGTSQSVRDLAGKYLQISGTFTGVLQLEVSLNGGSDFFNSVDAITGPGGYSIPEPATHVRVVVTDLESGTPVASLNGYNVRTDG